MLQQVSRKKSSVVGVEMKHVVRTGPPEKEPADHRAIRQLGAEGLQVEI
jgi:hypothetical protein